MIVEKATAPPRSVRLALAVVAACTTAVALYAVLRVAQALARPEPDPALVVWSEHSGFFWRGWTSAYVGATAGFVTWIVSARDATRVARLLARALVASVTLLALQALLVP